MFSLPWSPYNSIELPGKMSPCLLVPTPAPLPMRALPTSGGESRLDVRRVGQFSVDTSRQLHHGSTCSAPVFRYEPRLQWSAVATGEKRGEDGGGGHLSAGATHLNIDLNEPMERHPRIDKHTGMGSLGFLLRWLEVVRPPPPTPTMLHREDEPIFRVGQATNKKSKIPSMKHLFGDTDFVTRKRVLVHIASTPYTGTLSAGVTMGWKVACVKHAGVIFMTELEPDLGGIVDNSGNGANISRGTSTWACANDSNINWTYNGWGRQSQQQWRKAMIHPALAAATTATQSSYPSFFRHHSRKTGAQAGAATESEYSAYNVAPLSSILGLGASMPQPLRDWNGSSGNYSTSGYTQQHWKGVAAQQQQQMTNNPTIPRFNPVTRYYEYNFQHMAVRGAPASSAESAQSEYNVVLLSTLSSPSGSNPLRVLYKAEANCVDPKTKEVLELRVRAHHIGGHYFPPKAMHWYLHSLLGGAAHLVVGLHDGAGVVQRFERVSPEQLRRLGETGWSRAGCLSFLHTFLERVRTELGAVEEGHVLLAERNPTASQVRFEWAPMPATAVAPPSRSTVGDDERSSTVPLGDGRRKYASTVGGEEDNEEEDDSADELSSEMFASTITALTAGCDQATEILPAWFKAKYTA